MDLKAFNLTEHPLKSHFEGDQPVEVREYLGPGNHLVWAAMATDFGNLVYSKGERKPFAAGDWIVTNSEPDIAWVLTSADFDRLYKAVQ